MSSYEHEDLVADQSEPGIATTPLLQGNATPINRGWTVYLSFLALGLGTLLPWNFFITAESYWQYKFRNASETMEYNVTVEVNSIEGYTEKTYLQGLYTPMLVCLSQFTNCSFLIINALYSNKISVQKRLVSSLVAMMVLFIITTIFVKVNTDSWQSGFFIITMIMVVFLNCCGALFQGGLFGLAGMFPACYTTAVVTGQALGGVFASLARIISLAAGADDITSAFIFFMIADGVMALTLMALFYLFKTSLYQHHTASRVEETDKNEAPQEETEPLGEQSIISDFKRVAMQIWPYILSVFMVFCVTLAVFPAICVHIISNSDNEVWKNTYFQPVMTFLLFNVCDYLGRQLGGTLQWPRKASKLLYVFVLLRLLLIPLMMMCNHSSSPSVIPSLFLGDWCYFIIMVIFGLSNGYLGTLCMIYGPSSVDNARDAEKAGSIMAASLGCGLLGGALLSFAFGSLYV